MNQILDIGELVQENKRQENNRMSVFEEVLRNCHSLIKRYNKQRIREIHYSIPPMILGKPKYDLHVLRNYLVHHLRDNGLRVDQLSDTVLYISWKETDIDLAKYLHRKTIIDNREGNVYDINSCPTNVRPAGALKDQLDMLKFRQERQRKLAQEREERFQYQKARYPEASGNFEEYMRRY